MAEKWIVGGNLLPLEAGNNKQVPQVANKYGLRAYEIAGGRNLVFTLSSVREILSIAKQNDVSMSLHGQYATSALSRQSHANGSIQLAKDLMNFGGKALYYAHHFNSPVVMHPGGFDRHDDCQTSDVVNRLNWLLKESGYNHPNFVYLETMDGRFFGTFAQLWKISQEVGSRICVDWTHMWAKMSHLKMSFDEKFVRFVLRELETTDWKHEMYFHMGGAWISEKGEAEHADLSDSEFPYQMVLDEIMQSDLAGRIIVESNYTFMGDAVRVNSYLND